jgi:RNA recognition motif-containing protein
MPPTRVHLSSTDGDLETTASAPYGTRPTGARLERDRRVRKEQRSREEYARERAEDARIYVGNLSYTVQRNDVAKLFDEAGYDV